MATDIRFQLLDEIALEGLDGITLNTLWLRLQERPDFKQQLDDHLKSYLWRCITHQNEVEFYQLPEERPDLVSYNRFHYVDPETHHFLETEHIPDDIYPISVVKEDGIRGSCPTYKTRTNITKDIRDNENRTTLQDAIDRYGNHLVLVASQTLRWRTLIGESSDPNYFISDIQYCIIERIARSRYQGELSAGKLSLLAFNKAPKDIFYLLKNLSGLGVLRKQAVTVIKKPSNLKVSCILYHLKRFHWVMKERSLYEIQQIADYISSFPDKIVQSSVLKANFHFRERRLKKILQRLDAKGERFFEFIDIPYREVYPNATFKEYMAKNMKSERVIRHVKLVKDPHNADIDEPVDSDDDEQDEETAADDVTFHQVYDKPALAQMYTYIKNHGSKGVSQKDIERGMNLDGLAVRRRLKMLIVHGSIKTILHDFGKIKRSMYVAKEFIEENPIHQKVAAGVEKFDKMTSEKDKKKVMKTRYHYKKTTAVELKLNTAPPSDERMQEIRAELQQVELGNVQYFKKPLNSEQEKMMAERLEAPSSSTFQNVMVEEMETVVKEENRKSSEKFGMERFGTLLTEVHIRRANWIIEIVQAIKLLEHYQLRKIIRHREEQMRLPFVMDGKSLKRLTNALVEDKKIRVMKVTIKMENKEKMLQYIVDMDVHSQSEIIRKAVEEAKLRYFSVSKEELRGSKKRTMASESVSEGVSAKKKRFSAEVPESAMESILKHQDFKKKLSNKPPPMKYNRQAGPIYGLLPKFVRAQKIHQILWYLCYETYGKDTKPIMKLSQNRDGSEASGSQEIDMADQVTEPGTMKEPPLYLDELSWKRYLKPLPLHEGYPRGWCFISDVLLQLPVVSFCQIVNVCYDIPGLLDILSHPVQKFYPVKNLPFHISQQLLFARRYIHSIHDTCLTLCEMGLLSFGPDSMHQKELTFIYIHSKVSLLDTRDSLLGYTKTKPPPGTSFPRKTYELTTEESLNNFWEDLQIFGLGSNLGYKSASEPNDEVSNEEHSFKDALLRRTPSTVEDVGKIPGDMRGAAGLDSSLFCHATRNWTKERNQMNSEHMQRYLGRKHKEPKAFAVTGKAKKVPASKGWKIWQTKVTRNVKGNKGGKGIKKIRDPHYGNSVSGSWGRRRSSGGVLRRHRPPRKYDKKPMAERGDAKDQSIFNDKKKQRVSWTSQEDTLLLICNVASLLMERNRRSPIVSYIVIRDILHEKCPDLSFDKTSFTCSRRLKFILKNPSTFQNMCMFFQEASQDQYIIKEFSSKSWIATDEHVIVPKYKVLVDYLIKKFNSMNVGKYELPESLSELESCTIQRLGSPLKTKRTYKDVTSTTDICEDVLRNIFHSAVLLNDKQGRAHEMFKLLTQYPDSMLNNVIKSMKNDGLLVIHKSIKDRRKRITPGIGLRNFKASQKYTYNYKQRYLSALFEEGAELLNQLTSDHMEDGQGIELEYNPKGYQAITLIPLVLMRKVDMKVTLPEELVVVDMEGFYRFPWGRGKLASKSEKFKQSAEMLQEFFPGTDFGRLKLPGESIAVGGANLPDPSKKPNAGSKESDDQVLKKLSKDNDYKELSSSGEAGVLETIAEEDEVECSKTAAAEIDKNNDTDEVNEEKQNLSTPVRDLATDSVSESLEKAESASKIVEKDKNTEDSKGNTEVKYDVYHHGSSEILLPQYEVVFKELQKQQHNIASRTLLNLRRSDEDSLEEIRIFNAQDNFVVNSCAICVKLRPEENKAHSGKDRPTASDLARDFEVSSEADNDIIKTNDEGGLADSKSLESGTQNVSMETSDESANVPTDSRDSCAVELDSGTELTDMAAQVKKRKEYMNKKDVCDRLRAAARQKQDTEREKLLGSLFLRRDKIKKLWDSLQQILPFKLELEAVWKEIKARGMPVTEITNCQQVYKIIDAAEELGIKESDLQKQFIPGFGWRRYVQMLIEQTAVLKVGVTETRYVSLAHCRPWVIHSFRNIKGRGLHREEDADDSGPLDEGHILKKMKLQNDTEAFTEEENRVEASSSVSYWQLQNTEDGDNDSNIVNDSLKTDRFSYERALPEEVSLDKVQTNDIEGTSIDNSHAERLSDSQTCHVFSDTAKVVGQEIRSEDNEKLQRSDVVLSDETERNALAGQNMSVRSGESLTDQINTAHTDLRLSVASEMMEEKVVPSTSDGRGDKRKTPANTGTLPVEPSGKSTYDKVRVLCQPWRKPEGGVNKSVLKMMLESVMLFLMLKPGSSFAALYNRYGPYLQPMVLKNLVEILENLGCLTRQYITPVKATLFSKPFQMFIANQESEDAQVLLVPTLECMYRLGQFSLEVYPGIEWPKLDEFSL